uniref:Insertion element IS150 protein InsJ-like helix-turn-helix domain-containing protein n=1 Tax=Gloeothece verrucosa (strain PCC 7822) TaxID=497965 RepID=E0UME8_GLOV7|nr:hypothetical protein Cyan7822_6336 [Gloeothece verrucosa PCC 7822]
MAKPYSYDLRKQVIEAIKLDGLKKSEASQLFNISRNTINLWCKRLEETGDYQAKLNKPPGNGHANWFSLFRVLSSMISQHSSISSAKNKAGASHYIFKLM